VDKTGSDPAGNPVNGAPADPEFYEQVFAADVGDDKDPFAAKSGERYVIRVDGVTPPKLRPVAEVRLAALAAWTQEQRQQALARKAGDLTTKANADKTLANVARELKVPVQQSPALSHSTNDTTFSTDLIQKIFQAQPGQVVQSPQGAGNYIIARITGIAHTAATGPEFSSGRVQLSQAAASDFAGSFANAARLREGVKVNEQMLQSALGQQ
jgi:peptidyl-prolyl cis-trans isomerase D